MKKLIIGLGIAAMVMGMASMASAAYDPSWVVNFKVSASDTADNQAGSSSFKTGVVGTTPAPPSGSLALVYAYSSNHGGNYITDGLSSFTGTAMQWVIKIGNVNYDGVPPHPATPPTMVQVLAWNPKNTTVATKNQFIPLDGETLRLYAYDGVNKGQQLFDFGTTFGTGAYSGDAGTFVSGLVSINTQYLLEVAPAGAPPTVPEPGSMVAMLSGLAGLVGFGVRRRK